MSKAIFFMVPTAGHVNPSLPLTAELVSRGEHILYFLTDGYRAKVESTGAEFRAYTSIGDEYFDGLDGSNPPNTAQRLAATSLEILPELVRIIHEEQPDYIVYDSMCPWGMLAAKHCGVKSVSSMGLLAFTPAMLIKSGLLPSLIWAVVRNGRYLLQYNRLAAQIKRDYDVKVPMFADFLNNTGDLTISYTSKTFQPSAESFGESFRYVGPAIAPRQDASNFPFDQLYDAQPLVYISLGTVINRNLTFYRNCISAFRDAPYQVVMSVGKNTDISALGTLPANFIVRGFVPQLDILARASVFVTHAGMNSVHEGLYYDVPLVLVPQQQEQTFVANRVVELGAGLKISTTTPEPTILREKTDAILQNPAFKQSASTLGEGMRSAGGQKRAVDEILKMVGGS
ncbi:MAG: glycosyltransferase [Aggregatilineales bacterium]